MINNFEIHYIHAICWGCASLYSQSINDSNYIQRCSFHFQQTIINQYKSSFDAAYTGAHSLVPDEENRMSLITTIYAGLRLWKNAEVFINPEVAGGEGLSYTFGVAASTNGETFRVSNSKPTLYLARLFLSQKWNLSKEK